VGSSLRMTLVSPDAGRRPSYNTNPALSFFHVVSRVPARALLRRPAVLAGCPALSIIPRVLVSVHFLVTDNRASSRPLHAECRD
jgi:hypothetical protein